MDEELDEELDGELEIELDEIAIQQPNHQVRIT